MHHVLCLLQVSVLELRRAQILIDSENRSGDGHLLFCTYILHAFWGELSDQAYQGKVRNSILSKKFS